MDPAQITYQAQKQPGKFSPIILATVLIGLILIFVILFLNLKGFTTKKDTSAPVSNQSLKQQIVCKRFTNLEEALNNVNIACVLDLSSQDLDKVSDRISKLEKLNELSLKNNRLTSIPKEVTILKNLITLDLSDNQIATISANIADLSNLQILDLSNNKITNLPDELSKLPLSSLKLTGNPISSSEKEKIKKLLPVTGIE